MRGEVSTLQISREQVENKEVPSSCPLFRPFWGAAKPVLGLDWDGSGRTNRETMKPSTGWTKLLSIDLLIYICQWIVSITDMQKRLESWHKSYTRTPFISHRDGNRRDVQLWKENFNYSQFDGEFFELWPKLILICDLLLLPLLMAKRAAIGTRFQFAVCRKLGPGWPLAVSLCPHGTNSLCCDIVSSYRNLKSAGLCNCL